MRRAIVEGGAPCFLIPSEFDFPVVFIPCEAFLLEVNSPGSRFGQVVFVSFDMLHDYASGCIAHRGNTVERLGAAERVVAPEPGAVADAVPVTGLRGFRVVAGIAGCCEQCQRNDCEHVPFHFCGILNKSISPS